MQKPDLTPNILKSHGITYDSAVIVNHDLESLPTHVNILREGLLDFESFLIRDVTRKALHDSCHNYDEIPSCAYRHSDNLEKWERMMLLGYVEMAKKISDEAQRLRQDKTAEFDWQSLFNQTVFKQRQDPLSKRYLEIDRFRIKDYSI